MTNPIVLTAEHLRQRLLLPTPALPACCDTHAAVLVCCINTAEPYLLLTRRTLHLSHHAGQISLPGGRVDPADVSLEATALREAQEEVGLSAAGLQLLGRLPDSGVLTGSGISITPVVAWSEQEPELIHNPYEVDEIIKLPLHLALDASQYGTDTLERDGVKREFRFLRYQEHYIWGATARIMLALSERAQRS
jgi:8-oxo-dGTP pyrophosphatase MutT (NUDIX family)